MLATEEAMATTSLLLPEIMRLRSSVIKRGTIRKSSCVTSILPFIVDGNEETHTVMFQLNLRDLVA